jgi:hypothetical protein
MNRSRISPSRIATTSISTIIASVLLTALLFAICAAPAAAGGARRAGVNASQPTDNSTWYLAEGSIAWGFDTYITIENPNSVAVNADVTFMPSTGANATRVCTLPAKSHTSIWSDVIWEDISGAKDFSTMVHCREGLPIAVDRTMTWTGPGAASPEAHSSIGVTAPETTWYLPEGSSKWGFECWLLIQNPGTSIARCNVTYMIEGAEPQTVVHDVPAKSRRSFSMMTDIGAQDASIKVDSNVPVIPERSMYRNNRREGHDSIGTAFVWKTSYLAEGTTNYGFTTYVLIQNPNAVANNANVTFMTDSGPVPYPLNPIVMPANSRKTIRVNDYLPNRDFSTVVTGEDFAVIAERAMYWTTGTGEACHDSIGITQPHKTFYLPDGWSGSAPAMGVQDYETYTLVQNPTKVQVSVRISYLTYNGQGNVVFTDTINAQSRQTYPLAARVTNNKVAILVECLTPAPNDKIIVERAIYWNSRGAGTDTIGGYSD